MNGLTRPPAIALALSVIAGLMLLATALVLALEFSESPVRARDADQAVEKAHQFALAERALAATKRDLCSAGVGYALTGRSELLREFETAKERDALAQGRFETALRAVPHDALAVRQLQSLQRQGLDHLKSIVSARRTGKGYDPLSITEASDGPIARAERRIRQDLVRAALAWSAAEVAQAHAQARTRGTSVIILGAASLLGVCFLLAAAGWDLQRWRRIAAESLETNLELETARAEAKRANEAKAHFVTTVGHDLRQPLHAISLYTDVLSRRLSDPGAAPIIARINAATASIARMSRQLLDLSRFESTAYAPRSRPESLHALLQAVGADVEAQAWSAGVRLTVVPTSLATQSDAALIESVVRNLVWNAISHAAGSRIVVGARRAGAHVRIKIWDNGTGLPPDKVRFLRGEAPIDTGEKSLRGRDSGGLGLGLAIVRRCVELLDATLDVRSSLKGSCFRLTLKGAANA